MGGSINTVSVVSGIAGEDDGIPEGLSDMARGSADLAQSWDAPLVEVTER